MVKFKTKTAFPIPGKRGNFIGDFIIRGVKGEHYPCKPNIFTETYEDA